MKKKITFQDPASRRVGLLAHEATIERLCAQWADDDHEMLLLLCRQRDIKDTPTMFYELALSLARELYPRPKQRGRKKKWTTLSKGALVVEVERLMRPNDLSHGVEWACKQLSKREPWASFLEEKEGGTVDPDPTEALRQIYFDFRNDKWANIFRDAFRMYEHEGGIAEWEKKVTDFVRNPHPK